MPSTLAKICFLFSYACLFFTIQISPVQAQTSQLPQGFTTLTVDDGLPQGFITSILQDSQGFMWFGTQDGVCRYDGYSFTEYRYNPFDTTSISGNFFTLFFEDQFGYVWGTSEGVINRIDPVREKVHRYPLRTDSRIFSIRSLRPKAGAGNQNTENIKNPIVFAALGTNGQVFYISFKPGQGNTAAEQAANAFMEVSTIPLPEGLKLEQPDAATFTFVKIDGRDFLWLSGKSGILYAELPAGDSQPWRFRHIESNVRFRYFTQDASGAIWGASTDSLICFKTVAGQAFNTQSLPFPDFFLPPHTRQGIWLTTDARERVWIKNERGLLVFDQTTSTLKKPEQLFQGTERLWQITWGAPFEDRSNVLWFPSNGFGLLRYDKIAARFNTLTAADIRPEPAASSYVGGFRMDQNDDILVQMAGKKYHYNRDRNELIFKGKRWNDVYIQKRADGRGFWVRNRSAPNEISATNGLFLMDSLFNRQKTIFPDQEHPEKFILWFQIIEDQDGVWFVTRPVSGDGKAANHFFLHFWHEETEQTKTYTIDTSPTELGTHSSVGNMIRDDLGAFWFRRTVSSGLIRVMLPDTTAQWYWQDVKNQDGLNRDRLKCLLVDPQAPDRFLWIGTNGGGLNRMDIRNETFSHFTTEQGLADDVIYGILADDHGNLWLSSNGGMSKVDLDSKTRDIIRVKNYNVDDGLQGNEFNSNAYIKNSRGEMFFGGVNGFTWFHPDSVRDNQHVPPMVITKVETHGSATNADSELPWGARLSRNGQLALPYNENVVTFEFAALDYSNPAKNLYSYKLENLHNDWSPPSTDRRVTFAGLEPGEYIFRVKGSNNDGVWNETGALLKIVILPPWWRTWWAYFFYGLSFLFGLSLLWRYETNRQKHKHAAHLRRIEAQKLQEVDHLKSTFFTNISHEIRTPLTLILGQTESLLPGEKDKSRQSKLQMAFRNAKSLLRLINQLLDLSKLEAGGMTLNAKPGNIVPLIKSLTYSFESLALQKKIDLRFDSEHEGVIVNFEQDKIEKIMYNLLSNALKFTPEKGKISVLLTVNSTLKSTDHQFTVHSLQITVRDSGIGIPQDRLPHIFDRFYQVDSAKTREPAPLDSIGDKSRISNDYNYPTGHEGTGVGLALTKELVELHGGTISAESSEGFGATFVVQLPAVGVQDSIISDEYSVNSNQYSVISDQSAAFADELPTANGQQPKANSRKPTAEIILIVEDNADVRTYVRQTLEDDYRVVEAKDGEDGFQKAREYIPDLIISDVMMPRIHGYELARILRGDQVTSHIPIIMLTAKAAEDEKLEGLETGVDAYVIKPFSTKELRVRVRKLIEMRRLLREKNGVKAVLAPSSVEAVSMDQEFLQKVQGIVEENLASEDFNVDVLAAKCGMGKRQLQRKLKALTGASPMQCIRRMRLQRAKQLLEQKTGTVSEIAFQVGYGDVTAFSKAFRNEFGQAPSTVASNKKSE